MKVLILAGGFGIRLSEETLLKPKPMVEIGGKPILWHIMKIYSAYGFNEFVILLGYKGYMIKEYFFNYLLHQSDLTIDLPTNRIEWHNRDAEPWKLTLIDTGYDTLTGGRVKRAQPYIDGQPFLLTYGDGVCDVNISDLVRFHQQHGKLMTMTSVQPMGRFGQVHIETNSLVTNFQEKPRGEGGWINGGYFVCQPEVMDYIEGDHIMLEREPLENLARDRQLVAFQHLGFWQCMDTMRDKQLLEACWESKPEWKVWS